MNWREISCLTTLSKAIDCSESLNRNFSTLVNVSQEGSRWLWTSEVRFVTCRVYEADRLEDSVSIVLSRHTRLAITREAPGAGMIIRRNLTAMTKS